MLFRSVAKESNIETILVSSPSSVPKLSFPSQISLIKVDQQFDIDKFAFPLASTPKNLIVKNTSSKVDVMIVQDEISQKLLSDPIQAILIL